MSERDERLQNAIDRIKNLEGELKRQEVYDGGATCTGF